MAQKTEKINPSYTYNPEFRSLEITFGNKPSEAVRSALKEMKFRWHSLKKCWYGYAEEAAVRAAIEGKGSSSTESKPKTKASEAGKKNRFGVQVGDIFHSSWGYDQTNNNFFQVVSLVGESSVRVREVNLPCLESSAVSPMSEDRTFSLVRDLHEPASGSVFIKDQVNGDLKRLKSYAADGVSSPQFHLSSFANAYYCAGDTVQVYESWYA